MLCATTVTSVQSPRTTVTASRHAKTQLIRAACPRSRRPLTSRRSGQDEATYPASDSHETRIGAQAVSKEHRRSQRQSSPTLAADVTSSEYISINKKVQAVYYTVLSFAPFRYLPTPTKEKHPPESSKSEYSLPPRDMVDLLEVDSAPTGGARRQCVPAGLGSSLRQAFPHEGHVSEAADQDQAFFQWL